MSHQRTDMVGSEFFLLTKSIFIESEGERDEKKIQGWP